MKMFVELTRQSVRTQTSPFSIKNEVRFATEMENKLYVRVFYNMQSFDNLIKFDNLLVQLMIKN